MKTPNTIERDINRIRLEIYEETKDMPPGQLTKFYKQRTEATIKKYGFEVIANAGRGINALEMKIKYYILITLTMTIFAFGSACSKKGNNPKNEIVYYQSFYGKVPPYRPDGPMPEAVAKSQKAYLVCQYNKKGELILLEKYLDGRIHFRHEYFYNKKGVCVTVRITDENNQIVEGPAGRNFINWQPNEQKP